MSDLVLSDLTLTAIQAEATRAYLLHGPESMLGATVTDDARLAILTEEVGEVARELNELRLAMRRGDGDWHALYRERKDALVKELIQVAAMAASWVEFAEGGTA